MAEVRPFHGIRFNQKITDLAGVICPPYDIISPAEQQAYHERSPCNVIRLEFGLGRPGDSAGNNKYSRAGETWRQWREQAVLETEASPSFYLHRHRFTHRGEFRERTGLMACVKLEPWDRKVILPHENTGNKPKEDRLELMRACQANISPIFALYQDSAGVLAPLLVRTAGTPPATQVQQENGESHSLWIISDQASLRPVEEYFAGQKLFIADGHHRYETALAYQRELRDSGAARPGADYVMMTLVESSDPGLVILPVHRLVRGLPAGEPDKLKARLHSLFDVKTLPLTAPDPGRRATMISDALRRRRNIGMAIGVWGLEKDNLLILRLRQGTEYDAMMPPGHSYYYYRLEVSRLQHLIMDELQKQFQNLEVIYTPDEVEVVNRVGSGEYQLGFFIKALEAKDIKSVALAGDKAPRKSSYFYPKLPTGIVMRSVNGGL